MQFFSGKDLINQAVVNILGQTGTVGVGLDFNGDDFNPAYFIDPVSFDLDLGTLNTGDTLSYVYTLTAQGTTHGFERGYDAFLGDPFGADVFTDNLVLTGTTGSVPGEPASVPEAKSTSSRAVGTRGTACVASVGSVDRSAVRRIGSCEALGFCSEQLPSEEAFVCQSLTFLTTGDGLLTR